jgi:hypothetical protein
MIDHAPLLTKCEKAPITGIEDDTIYYRACDIIHGSLWAYSDLSPPSYSNEFQVLETILYIY